jgi:amidase
MRLADDLTHDAIGLAGLVARREASPQELLDVALEQNARSHPRINAVCRLMDKEARANSSDRSPARSLASLS